MAEVLRLPGYKISLTKVMGNYGGGEQMSNRQSPDECGASQKKLLSGGLRVSNV